jgi:hypothetical protein
MSLPDGQGQWVSTREFDQVNLRIDSVERKVDTIGSDVKALLIAHALEEGAASERTLVLDAQRDRGARRIAWSAAVASILGAFWWVSDAVAKFSGHH